MNGNTVKALFVLLRFSLHGNLLTEAEKCLISDDVLPSLFSVAKSHDVLHLVALALKNNGLLKSEHSDIENEIIKAVFRYERLNYDYIGLCDALEAAEIPFIPLKGSVIRKYYPEPWMRTSCDVDVLVHEDEVESAASYLVDNCGYTRDKKGSHDITLFSQSKSYIELHYDLVEERYLENASDILKNVWEDVSPKSDKKYWCEMSDEMFYFYHIAHMAKHFANGGCGIRTFLDLWILDNIAEANQSKRNELLEKGCLLKFADAARLLCRVWFGDTEHTETTRTMEEYILRGGVYGTIENGVSVQQQKMGGKTKYMLSRVFISYDQLKYLYPILQKHRWLMPVMQVRRWFRVVLRGRTRYAVNELKYNRNISHSDAESMRSFLESIGI